jgi:hypothetical protein
MWLFKQNIFKLRRIIEEVITYFCDVFYSSHIGCMLFSYSEFRLLFCLLVLPSVILVTDNVTKAAQVIQMELTKHIDGNVVSQFQVCSVLSIVLNFHRRLLVLYYFRTSSFNHCTD